MRLDFNVLWVDDQPDRVDSLIKRISKQMADEGFQFNSALCRSIDEVRVRVGGSVFADEIDLILVDWDLGGGQEGQNAIAAIRENIPYKDVVFYSGQPADVLRKLAFEAGVEGIYCVTRVGLVEEVLGVFESLVKKVLDLDHTRGIVMGATCDIDFIVNECLVAIHARSDDEGKTALLAESRKLMDAKMRELSQLAERMQRATTFPQLFEAHLVFTAYDRLRVLAGALKRQSLRAHRGYRKSVTAYQQEVVPKRNVLGHVTRVLEGEAYVLTDHKGNVYTQDLTRDLRRVILGLRTDFRSLRDALQGGAASTLGQGPAGSE